jgi:3-hydroxyacyl-[acyl-carrier-protein] dehydratase
MTVLTEGPPAVVGSVIARPSPVDAEIGVVRFNRSDVDGESFMLVTALTEVGIDQTEPVFAGHYPDFPIFPGVCIVDCVHRSAVAVALCAGLGLPRLVAVESTRFLGAVYPGDLLSMELELREDDGWLRCKATASTERGISASVRLRLRLAGGGRP